MQADFHHGLLRLHLGASRPQRRVHLHLEPSAAQTYHPKPLLQSLDHIRGLDRDGTRHVVSLAGLEDRLNRPFVLGCPLGTPRE